jgi:hypothetical protein
MVGDVPVVTARSVSQPTEGPNQDVLGTSANGVAVSTTVEPIRRHRKAAICARLTTPDGSNRSAETPVVTPSSTSHATASAK